MTVVQDRFRMGYLYQKKPQNSATYGIFWNPLGEDFGDPYGHPAIVARY